MTTLSNNIRILRKKNGMTQKDLATICEVSNSAVSQWESSEKSVNPDLNNMVSMARQFDVSIEQLIESEDPLGSSQTGAGFDTRLMQKAFQALALNPQIYTAFIKHDSFTQASIFSLFCILCTTLDAPELIAEPKLLEALKLLRAD